MTTLNLRKDYPNGLTSAQIDDNFKNLDISILNRRGDNLYPDFDMVDKSFYVYGGAISFIGANWDTLGRNYIQISEEDTTLYTKWFPIAAETMYKVTAAAWVGTAGAGTANVGIQFATGQGETITLDSTHLIESNSATFDSSTSQNTVNIRTTISRRWARFFVSYIGGSQGTSVRAGGFRVERTYAPEIQNQIWTSGLTGGTAPNYTTSLAYAPSALSNGLRVHLDFHASNNGAATTLDVNGLGVKPVYIVTEFGSTKNPMIWTDQRVDLVYTGTYWQVVSGTQETPTYPYGGDIVANKTLTPTDAGRVYAIEAVGLAITLPLSSTVSSGTTFYIRKKTTSAASATIVGMDNASASYTIGALAGGLYAFTSTGTTGYMVHVTPQADLPISLNANGYAKLHNGLILQWGSGQAGISGTPNTINFPIAFPTQVGHVNAIHKGAAVNANIIVENTSNSSFKVSSSHPSQVLIGWFAIGN